MLSWGCSTRNLSPAPCLHKQATRRRAESKALTVDVQVRSCPNMWYGNLWCCRRRRNLKEKVRLSLRITAPQGSASTWNKEMHLKRMLASRLYHYLFLKALGALLVPWLHLLHVTEPEEGLHYPLKGISTPTCSLLLHNKLSTGANTHSKTKEETWVRLKFPWLARHSWPEGSGSIGDLNKKATRVTQVQRVLLQSTNVTENLSTLHTHLNLVLKMPVPAHIVISKGFLK